jgi:hypothetical protein
VGSPPLSIPLTSTFIHNLIFFSFFSTSPQTMWSLLQYSEEETDGSAIEVRLHAHSGVVEG